MKVSWQINKKMMYSGTLSTSKFKEYNKSAKGVPEYVVFFLVIAIVLMKNECWFDYVTLTVRNISQIRRNWTFSRVWTE
jgi:hypothetical protein